MKKHGKIVIFGALLLIFAAGPAFSQTPLDDLQAGVNSFSEDIAKGLPFNSTMGLNWSDAHIGQFLGIPPRFGVGFSLGFTTININAINNLLSLLGMGSSIDLNIGLPLPGYTVEGRLGGFVLPFDIGIKFGYIPSLNIPVADVGLEYLLIGTDLRYSLLPKKIPVVKVSVGLGYNHMSGGISKTLPMGQSFAFNGPNDTDYTLSITNPKVGLRWQTNVLELKAQASFSLKVITPYLGLGLSYGWSEAGYQVETDVRINGAPASQANDEVKQILGQAGLSNLGDTGFESIINNDAFNVRFFGGFSINLPMVRFDFTGMYNVISSNWGVTFGTRFQL